MGFITNDDFELLSQWGGKDYDANNSEHKQVLTKLQEIYQKIQDIGNIIDKDTYTCKKHCTQQNGPKKSKFREYHWGRFHPIKDKRLCITISIDADKNYRIKIDTDETEKSGLSKEERTIYEKLRDENYNRINHDTPASEISILDKDKLVELTKKHLNELKKEWDWVYSNVFGSSKSIAQKENEITEFDIKEKKRVSGLIACDSGDWFQETISEIESKGKSVTWWDCKPTDQQVVIKDLIETINEVGYFYVYYARKINGIRDTVAYYRAKVVDFAVGKDEYEEKDWQSLYPSITVPYEDYCAPTKSGSKRTASILFLIEEMIVLETPVSVNDFNYYAKWKPPTQNNLQPILGFSKNISTKNEIKDFNLNLNTILYGPPGTGKTYKIQNKYIPDFTDTDETKKSEYLEEVVGKLEWCPTIVLTMLILDKEEITRPEILSSAAIKIRLKSSKADDAWDTIRGQLQIHAKMDCPATANYEKTNRSAPYVFWQNKNSTWKIDKDIVKEELPEVYAQWQKLQSFKEKRYDFITFHQSFSYEDFIEGIKPDLDNEADTNDLSYVIAEGVFLRLAKKADLNPNENWALFIDEINRGNISNIFGELITLIEDDKRAGEENELSAILPYSKTKFTVPKNLFIIGTMNTADRGIEAIDSALRRRFSFIEVKPQPELLTDDNGEALKIEGVNLVTLLKVINERLLVLVGKDSLIGHSYLMKLGDISDLQHVFKNKIIPLLEEYFYNDRKKIGMVLGDSFVKTTDKEKKITFAKGFENDELLDDTEIYIIKNPLEATPEDFIRIYE